MWSISAVCVYWLELCYFSARPLISASQHEACDYELSSAFTWNRGTTFYITDCNHKILSVKFNTSLTSQLPNLKSKSWSDCCCDSLETDSPLVFEIRPAAVVHAIQSSAMLWNGRFWPVFRINGEISLTWPIIIWYPPPFNPQPE